MYFPLDKKEGSLISPFILLPIYYTLILQKHSDFWVRCRWSKDKRLFVSFFKSYYSQQIHPTVGRILLRGARVAHCFYHKLRKNSQIHRQALPDVQGIFVIFRCLHNCFGQRRWKLYLSYVLNNGVL